MILFLTEVTTNRNITRHRLLEDLKHTDLPTLNCDLIKEQKKRQEVKKKMEYQKELIKQIEEKKKEIEKLKEKVCLFYPFGNYLIS